MSEQNKLERSTFTSQRSASDGSFLILEGDLKQYSLENPIIKTILSAQKPPHTETLKAILTNGVKMLDKQQCVGYKELPEITAIPLKRMQLHLRELRALNVIIPVEFVFTDGSHHPKVKAETLNLDFAPPAPVVIEEIEPAEISPDLSLAEKRWKGKKDITSALHEHNVQPIEKRVDAKNLPHVVRPRGEFIVDQLVSNKARPRGKKGLIARQKNYELQRYEEQSRKFVIPTESGPKNFLAKVRSYTSVMDAKDLQAQFAIYSLIYDYHSYFYDLRQSKPRNLTPVYVDDIILMLGRKPGGKNRDYVRDCIQIIEDTEFNLSSLDKTKFQIDDTVLNGFASSNYKNFKTCIAITNTAATEDPETGRVILPKDAMTYLIALPDHIFENLIQNESVFAFPPETLRMRVLMFALYLRFRSLVRERTFAETLTKLKDKLQYDESSSGLESSEKERYNSFLNALKIEFRHLAKTPQDHLWAKFENDSIKFNILGYHGEFDFKAEKYYVKCHLQEMLHCCKVVNHNTKAIAEASAAPLVYNGMSTLFPERIHKRLNVAINKIITSEPLMFNMRYTNEARDYEVLVSKYAQENEILEAAEALDVLTQKRFDIEVLHDKIERDLEGLTGLKLGRHVVTKEQLDKLLQSEFLEMYVLDIDVIDLLQKINRTRSIHRDLLDYFNEGIFSAKLTKFLEHYIETKLPEEAY